MTGEHRRIPGTGQCAVDTGRTTYMWNEDERCPRQIVRWRVIDCTDDHGEVGAGPTPDALGAATSSPLPASPDPSDIVERYCCYCGQPPNGTPLCPMRSGTNAAHNFTIANISPDPYSEVERLTRELAEARDVIERIFVSPCRNPTVGLVQMSRGEKNTCRCPSCLARAYLTRTQEEQ